MKLARWNAGDRDFHGVIEGTQAFPASANFSASYPDLDAVLAAGATQALARDARVQPAMEVSEISWRVPLSRHARVFCVGINFPKRNPVDQTDGRPDNIILFAKLDGTLVAHGEALEIPGGAAANSFDYEGEIGVVIGTPARDVSPGQALAHVAGYTVVNDGSVREWQKHSVHAGKNFANSGACGPWLVTADEVAAPLTLRQVTRLNGQVVQDATAAEMFYSIPEVISYISHCLPLRPGDMIAMGSPEGTGASRKPQRFLQAGDTLEIEVDGVGILKNRVG
jgi:2-keto-4-pentenoate hydratase/2-oxohepta-3-ene-1,7-dioic acid hydratase in catechol pathway